MKLNQRLATLAAIVAVAAGCGKAPGFATGRVAPLGDLGASTANGPALNGEPDMVIVEPSYALVRPLSRSSGNWGKLHNSAPETLPALKALFSSAQKSIWIETFEFGNDAMGQQICPILVAKAKAGVEVKVVADYVGSRFIKGHVDMARKLRAAGVDFRLYKPRFILKDDKRRGINIQHRKLYMVDGERALCGGVNLVAHFESHTQDVLVEWKGPIVDDLAREWAFDWKAAGGRSVTFGPPQPAAPGGTVEARVAVTSPAEGRYEAREAIYAAIEGAQHEIRIVNQYLWDDGIMVRLHAALKRGVKVKCVVPGDEDHGPWKALHAEELKQLIDLGGEARLFTGSDPQAHLHTKYFGVDERWVAIGSTNGDTRALMDNQEMDTIIEDEALAADFRDRMFQQDWTVWSKPFVYKPGSPMSKPFRKLIEILDYYF
jgi:cardiolipin synthase